MTQSWTDRVQDVYFDLEELEANDELYDIVRRCGFESALELWAENPFIGGSVNPEDFGLARIEVGMFFHGRWAEDITLEITGIREDGEILATASTDGVERVYFRSTFLDLWTAGR